MFWKVFICTFSPLDAFIIVFSCTCIISNVFINKSCWILTQLFGSRRVAVVHVYSQNGFRLTYIYISNRNRSFKYDAEKIILYKIFTWKFLTILFNRRSGFNFTSYIWDACFLYWKLTSLFDSGIVISSIRCWEVLGRGCFLLSHLL